MKRLMKSLMLTALMVVAWCAGTTAQNTTPPAPGNLTAQSPAELQPRVFLSWNSLPGPWFFKVYRSVGDTNAFQWIGIGQTARFEDRSVVGGTLYYYYVTATQFEDSVLLESSRSNIAEVRAYALPAGPKGVIAGRVIDELSSQPIQYFRIRFFKILAATNRIVETTTDAAGNFVALLDTGSYFVKAEEFSTTVAEAKHRGIWYDGAPTPETATPVDVRVGDTARVEFRLSPTAPNAYAYVSGVVTDANGIPLSGAAVAFVRPIQEMNEFAALSGVSPGTGSEAKVIPGIGYTRGVVWVGFTNPSGKFFAQVLSGRQYVAMAAKDGYYPELFDNTSDPTQATPLTILGDTTGINFSLDPVGGASGEMQGSVEDEDGGDVPARIILFPRPRDGNDLPAVFVHTDSSGMFEANDLPAGTYSILAIPYSDYSTVYYSEGDTSALSWLDADTVVVNGSPVALTIRLPRLQAEGLTRISGHVRTTGMSGLPGVRIVARTDDGRIAGYGLTEPTGEYRIDAIISGPITLFVDRFQFNLVQSPITVPQNTYTLSGVDFILTETYPTAVQDDGRLPGSTRLLQNYPNPFNPVTTIPYDIARPADIQLRVFDILGREVAVLARGLHKVGSYAATLDGSKLPSGVYYCVLVVDGVQSRTQVARMLLLK